MLVWCLFLTFFWLCVLCVCRRPPPHQLSVMRHTWQAALQLETGNGTFGPDQKASSDQLAPSAGQVQCRKQWNGMGTDGMGATEGDAKRKGGKGWEGRSGRQFMLALPVLR